MKKKFLLAFIALTSIFSAMAITIVPVTSTAGNEVWYTIKCNPRDPAAPLATWLSVLPNDSLIYSVYSGGDEQLWKVVENGTGVALVNKKYGYLNSDARSSSVAGKPRQRLSTQATMPTTPLRFVPSTGYPTLTWPGWDTKTPGVFIVNNTASLTVSATNTFTVNNFDEAFNLAIYAPASGLHLLVVTNPSWAGNLNSVVLFRTPKDLAEEAIAVANTIYNNSSAGPNPGQYSESYLTSLKTVIDATQDVCNNTASTAADFNAATSELNNIVTIFKSAVITPQISGNTDTWYALKGLRFPATPYLTSTGVSAVMKTKTLTLADEQLWKLVETDANDGWVFQNKATGEYIDCTPDRTTADAGIDLVTSATKPLKGLKFRLSTVVQDGISCFIIENSVGALNFRLYSGATNVQNDTKDNDNNINWVFMDYAAAQREILKNKLTDANTVVTTTQVGNNPGQVTTAVIDEFKAAVATAQATYDDPNQTGDDYVAAATSLADAKVTLRNKANLPIISTDQASTWYSLNGTRPAIASVITNNANDSVVYQVSKSEDSEYWRFVANGTGFAIQNKATSKYIACDSVDGSYLTTQVAMPTRPLKCIVSDEIALGAFRIIIENDTTAGSPASFRLHAGNEAPMNYAGDVADNCGWLIADNAQAIRNAYTILKNANKPLYTKSIAAEGNCFGQYPASSRADFNTALTNADAVNLTAMTYTQLADAYAVLNNATTAFINSRVTDINVIASTATNPKWFYISGASPTATGAQYKKCMIKSTANISASPKVAGNTDQMWRFELNTNAGDNTVKLVNKTTNEEFSIAGQSTAGTLIASGGTFLKLGIHGDGVSTKFTYLDGTAERLLHFNGSPVVGWYDNLSTSSAWRIDPVADNTSVKDVTVAKLNIRSNNGEITIEGVDKFEIYSIMGQKMNTKATLNKGIYIIKVGKTTQKYIIR